jgi:hypothetical protein
MPWCVELCRNGLCTPVGEPGMWHATLLHAYIAKNDPFICNNMFEEDYSNGKCMEGLTCINTMQR